MKIDYKEYEEHYSVHQVKRILQAAMAIEGNTFAHIGFSKRSLNAMIEGKVFITKDFDKFAITFEDAVDFVKYKNEISALTIILQNSFVPQKDINP